MADLRLSRQAALSPVTETRTRRFSASPDLAAATSTVVVGSKPNGLPPGMALHAELRALAAAGLDGDRVLKAAGANAAAALGLQGDLGRIAPGALADLVIVTGDPRTRVADALDIVAVIRNGRFYSLVSLLERAERQADVE
jgi:imidazolonepropionase-like amidohydrolase